MNQFLKKVFILFILVSSVNLFAQDDDLGEKQKTPFQPKFTLGSGIYTLTGDIQNADGGFLKGKSGFNVGMKFDLIDNLDLSFLVIKTAFSANNGSEDFSSDIDGFGLHLGYKVTQILNESKISPVMFLGVQRLGVSTTILGVQQERASSIVIPVGFGVRMDITERLQFDMAINFGMGMGDIDMSQEGNSDGYKSLNFAIYYDLFTPAKNVKNDYVDDSYYEAIDFAKLESEDEDGDLVRDLDDYCPQTPTGVKVDENGCPLDDDKDGIANYLDKEANTPIGSIVDENGVKLAADKYQSTYSDFEVASRKYANFYNEVEIKRENYKTVDEYLVAKANAFNKAFNESLNDNSKVKELIYKVKLGEFKDGIPARITNKLLSLDDLESFRMDDDVVIYAVGSYNTLNEAMARLAAIEEKGFDDTYIIVDNNGEISNYVEPGAPGSEIDEEEVVVAPDQKNNNNDITDDGIVEVIDEPINETIYRVQIGASFKNPLSDAVFSGVNNVVSFTGKDGFIRYMVGSFTEYKDALDYQAQMKARGFEDAFIVTYKNGERISLNIAIKAKNVNLVEDKKSNTEGLKFTVQIMVAEVSVSAANLEKISKLGSFDKKAKGSDMYEYYAGSYSNLEEANVQLEKAKRAGFKDAFVFATNNGKRITLEEAKALLK